MFENSQLNKKLENLENVFIGSAIEKNDDGSVSNSKITDSYSNKNVSSWQTNLMHINILKFYTRCIQRTKSWESK